jgi:hypothetical protein
MLAKPTLTQQSVLPEQNASGMHQEQQNVLMMFVTLIRLIHHVKQMRNVCGQHLHLHAQQTLALSMQIQLNVELLRHASGTVLTASKTHAKFMPLILHAMLKQNVFGIQLQQLSALQMYALSTQIQQSVELM